MSVSDYKTIKAEDHLLMFVKHSIWYTTEQYCKGHKWELDPCDIMKTLWLASQQSILLYEAPLSLVRSLV